MVEDTGVDCPECGTPSLQRGHYMVKIGRASDLVMEMTGDRCYACQCLVLDKKEWQRVNSGIRLMRSLGYDISELDENGK